MKKSILLLFLFLSYTCIFSQEENYKVGDTIYYKKNYKSSKDDADFFSVITKKQQKEDKNYYTMDGFIINKKDHSFALKSKYNTTSLNKKSRTGNFIGYHKNGNISSKGIFKKGKKIGKWTNWYKTGKIREERMYYDNNSPHIKSIKTPDVLNFWNKNGKQTLVDGNGYFERKYTYKRERKIRKGVYKDGKKDGVFIGYNGDRKFFEELYKRGKLLKGTSWDEKGNKYTYKKDYINPRYKGGQESIAKYFKENYTIPNEAKKYKIRGKVIVDFLVNTDGRVSDLKIVKSLCEPCDLEAMLTLKTMRGWKPAVSKGKKVRKRFTMPITISYKYH